MSKNGITKGAQTTATPDQDLDNQELETVRGAAAPDLTHLSRLQVAPRNTSGLLGGFQQPVVRPHDLHVVDPGWVSDSVGVSVFCVSWGKDYTDPPPPPPPPEPDGDGGAPGKHDLGNIDLGGVDLGGLGRGGLNRGGF